MTHAAFHLLCLAAAQVLIFWLCVLALRLFLRRLRAAMYDLDAINFNASLLVAAGRKDVVTHSADVWGAAARDSHATTFDTVVAAPIPQDVIQRHTQAMLQCQQADFVVMSLDEISLFDHLIEECVS